MASNFERMVRIADATGIQLDARMAALSQEVRETPQLERFHRHIRRGNEPVSGKEKGWSYYIVNPLWGGLEVVDCPAGTAGTASRGLPFRMAHRAS